jgi:beta-lactamase regulating signal transducer with metallopeptidase domain
MSGLISWLNSLGDGFVLFTIRMLIQSSVLILILLLLDLFLRRRVRAVVRYWIWLLVLAKLVLPPSLSSPTSVVSWIGGRLPETTIVSFMPDLPADAKEAAPPAALNPMEVKAFSAAPVQPMVLPTWRALVLLAWVAAVVIMVVLLIQRVFFVRALLAQSQEAPDALSVLLEQCRRHIGVRRVVRLRLTGLSASPSVCGLLRPVILMPEPMARQLETPQLRSVLFHELAHIQRGDLWVNLLQTLLQIVYLYHPLLWLANARIRAIREQAVDEAVLAALVEDAEEYPRTLLSISKLAFGTPSLSLRLLGVVESKRALTVRIRHMVGRPFPRSASLGLAGLVGVLVVGAALLPMARANGSASSADVPGASTAAPVVLAGSAGPDARTPVAKTELESKPATEKANPPEAGITPRRPFERQPVMTLNAWVSLKVLEECVVTLDGLKPFSDFWARCRWRVVGLLSEKQVVGYIGGRLEDKGSLPIRVYIYYQPGTSSAAQRLADAVMSLAREAKADMDTEVHLELTTWTGSGESTFYLREGKIRTLIRTISNSISRGVSRSLRMCHSRFVSSMTSPALCWPSRWPTRPRP